MTEPVTRPPKNMPGDAEAACPTEAEINAMSTEDLMRRYKESGSDVYKWPLVLRYEKQIRTVAMQMRSLYAPYAEVGDIVNEGIIAVASAIERFDPERGVKFETYISKRLFGTVVSFVRKQGWLPRRIWSMGKSINRVTTELYYELGRFPTDAEIAERLEMSVEKYQKVAYDVAFGSMLSLEACAEIWSSGGGGEFQVPSESAMEQPEEAMLEREKKDVLADIIKKLKPNEQMVLSLYFEQGLLKKEVASVMGISAARVSQLYVSAMQKIRIKMNEYIQERREPK